MEAALSGLPAMAVSLGKNREDLYGRAADLALKVLERSEGKKLSGFVLNLNVPETDELSGIRMAPLGMLNYQDGFRLISEDEEDSDINIMLGEKREVINVGNNEIIIRRMEGEFIKYNDILPKENTTNVIVSKEMLLESIERAYSGFRMSR